MKFKQWFETVKEPPIVRYRRIAAEIEAGLPPPPAGHTRLWRGNRPGEVGQNPQFTNSLDGIALPFKFGYGGDLSYIDVPTNLIHNYLRTGAVAPDSEFIVPKELARTARVVSMPGS